MRGGALVVSQFEFLSRTKKVCCDANKNPDDTAIQVRLREIRARRR
jgi:hypothetical protein